MTEKKPARRITTRSYYTSLALLNIIIRRRVNPEKAAEPVSEEESSCERDEYEYLLRLHL